MAYAAINQVPVADGHLTLPEHGRGVAVLRLAVTLDTVPFVQGEAVFLEMAGTVGYIMTAIQVQPKGGFWSVLLVQGSGKLETTLRPKWYDGIAISTVLSDAIREAGEQVGTIEITGILPKYLRRGSSLGAVLENVLHGRAERYWFEADGKISVGKTNYPTREEQPIAFESRAERRSYLLPIMPDLQPRVTLAIEYAGTIYRERIARVIHSIGQQLRTEAVWVGSSDHIAALERMTKDTRLDYALKYPCKILKDHGDNHFDVKPDDNSLPALTRVPWRAFAPAVLLEVNANTRAELEFENGDSSKPVLTEFEAGGIKNLTVPASVSLKLGGSSAVLGVVRTNDQVDVTIYVAPSLLGKLSAIPSLEPQPIGPPLPFIPMTFTGVNTGGSSIVKAVD